MGMDDREGAYRSRGDTPRRRPYDGDESPARSSARAPRDMDNPRSRPPRRDYDDDAGYNRSSRDPRGGSARGGSRYGADDTPRRPRPEGAPRRAYDGGQNDYDRPTRSPRSDPNASYSRGDRSGRSGRPPARDDGWGDARGARSGARAGASGSSGRMRREGPGGARGGGLWGDEPQSYGSLNGRDARGRRFAAQDEEEETSAGATAARALGSIVLALALGGGVAYGYYVVSAPKLNVPASQQVAPAASSTASPSVSPAPSATKTGHAAPSDTPYILLVY